MPATTFDAIIIGSGQAGNPLATALAGAGRKVALIEENRLGGSCINYGCSPTKTLLATAAALINKGLEAAIASKRVTYDFERQMEGATLLKTSEFAQEIVNNM